MKKSKIKIIKEIEASVPQEWRDKLITEVYLAPELRQEAINRLAEFPQEIEEADGDDKTELQKQYRRLQNIFDAGYYNAKEKKVDPIYSKKIDEWVEMGIKEAMKNGDLPKKDTDDELKKYVKKIKKHERQNTKSSIRS